MFQSFFRAVGISACASTWSKWRRKCSLAVLRQSCHHGTAPTSLGVWLPSGLRRGQAKGSGQEDEMIPSRRLLAILLFSGALLLPSAAIGSPACIRLPDYSDYFFAFPSGCTVGDRLLLASPRRVASALPRSTSRHRSPRPTPQVWPSACCLARESPWDRSEEHTSELQS